MHGSFQFEQQMYQQAGSSIGFMELTDSQEENYVSRGVQEFIAYYSNRLSYEDLSDLIERTSGVALLSSQGAWNIVQQNVQKLSDQLSEQITAMPEVERVPLKYQLSESLDLYDKSSAEILLFDDGILVKAQKEKREKPTPELVESIAIEISEREKTNVLSDVILLQIEVGKFEYLLPPINTDGTFRILIEDMILQRLHHQYGSWTKPLPLVVISDGARVIRQRIERMFGLGICVILDWYHLSKKIRDLMSMIAQNKTDKAAHILVLLRLLWQGKVKEAMLYLKTQVTVRNSTKHQELLTYLDKHQAEIIDYERRKLARKPIGSGRMEKAVDQVIGHRQKRKGMSWRPQGSRALALLKVLELNGGWHNFWFSSSTKEIS